MFQGQGAVLRPDLAHLLLIVVAGSVFVGDGDILGGLGRQWTARLRNADNLSKRRRRNPLEGPKR